MSACSSSGGGDDSGQSYTTITCGDYADLANADDAMTNGAITIATEYMNSTPIDPVGGAADAADFGDQILSTCDTATPDTKILALRPRIVSVFLAQHPEDGS